MDASRLLAVLGDIEVETGDLVPFLTKLTQAYTTARDTPAQDLSETIRQVRQDVRTFLASSRTNVYTPSRRQLLQAIEGERFVGNTAAGHLDAVLAEASMSPASALTALQAYVSQVNQFRATCTQARQGLTALNIKPDVLVGDQAEVGVLLPRTLTGGHLGALTGQLRRWNSILRGFTELAGADEREITVRMLSTGSEQIFLLTSIGVATVFILPVIERVLDLYKKILDIQKARKELERLGAPVEESQRVKEHEKKLVEDSIAGLAKELMARAETTVPPGRKGELENHLTISIRYMARFVDQGGDVEVTVAPPPREDYVPPADPAALTAAEVEGHKAEWTAVQERKIQDRLELARKGAALVGLPSRETEILQLPEADPAPLAEPIADGEGGQKEDKRKKK